MVLEAIKGIFGKVYGIFRLNVYAVTYIYELLSASARIAYSAL